MSLLDYLRGRQDTAIEPEPEPRSTLDDFECRTCGRSEILALRRNWQGKRLDDIFEIEDGTLVGAETKYNSYYPCGVGDIELYACHHCSRQGASLGDVVRKKVPVVKLEAVT